jgi:hypothetical protein
MVKLTTQLFELLDKYSFENKNEQITYTLPLSYSGRSITVEPSMALPNGDISYASFNPEVNKVFFVTKETGKKVFFPGTVVSNLQSNPSSKILVFTEESTTNIDYQHSVSSEIKYVKLNESMITLFRARLAEGRNGSIQTFFEGYTN